jgi:ankyrin repeat protein
MNDKDSPLFEAARRGDNKKIEELLAQGANVNAKDYNGMTALDYAVHVCQSVETVELLVAKGAALNAASNIGWTPLHIAAAGSKTELVRLLIAHGADVTAKDKEGRTPLNLANNDEKVALLLSNGADINDRSPAGYTQMHKVAHLGSKNLAELLLAKGFSLGIDIKLNTGETPLKRALISIQGLMIDGLPCIGR